MHRINRIAPVNHGNPRVGCLTAHVSIKARMGITAWTRRLATSGLRDQVQGGADDAVGVDAVIAVEVLDRPGLAELRHAQRGVRHLVDGGQER